MEETRERVSHSPFLGQLHVLGREQRVLIELVTNEAVLRLTNLVFILPDG